MNAFAVAGPGNGSGTFGNNVSFYLCTAAWTTLRIVSSLSISPDVSTGENVSVGGYGFNASQELTKLVLGGFHLNCTAASVGTCADGLVGTDPDGSFDATIQVPAFIVGGSYSLFAQDSGGLNATTTTDVYTLPLVAIPVASPSSIDLGQVVTFQTSAVFGDGNYTYAWQGLPRGCGGVVDVIRCVPSLAGRFNVSASATDGSGTSEKSANLLFVVYSDPTVTTPTPSVPSGSVDAGQNVTFAAIARLGSLAVRFIHLGRPPPGLLRNVSGSHLQWREPSERDV